MVWLIAIIMHAGVQVEIEKYPMPDLATCNEQIAKSVTSNQEATGLASAVVFVCANKQ